uniref:Uncharacterized protein n=1 Tax=Rhizophora mucronata TaxID=61149 RepID=A0A2P2K7T3_RHIMU
MITTHKIIKDILCNDGIRHCLEPGLHLLKQILHKSCHISSALFWILTIMPIHWRL